jgi:hypothetical protein
VPSSSTAPSPLPPLTEAPALLKRLGVPDEDAGEILAAWPSVERDADALHDIARGRDLLVAGMGGTNPVGTLPRPVGASEALRRYFDVHVYLATLPDVRAFHAARGIPDDVSWASLGDLGAHVAMQRRIRGVGGLDAPWWLVGHFRGTIYRLGRLQFERFRIESSRGRRNPMFWFDPADPDGRRPGYRPGDHALAVHIPEGGPLAPEAVDRSLEWAAEFFPRHFPDEHCRVAVCTSWLLDDGLGARLREDSNIVRFARRFRLVPGALENDESVVRFVFHREGAAVDALPRTTSLERAVVDTLATGEHVYSRTGWLALQGPQSGSGDATSRS